ncbi:RNA polymerase sigma factor [Neolewinella antarctica]|uniref:RNA polymerase sigma-70 factor (ECF subfamily) n=1 Tax=Neolewinella antarctica TaxID=442734 RepID=A0ABX0XG96_9BACT|nr:sigma-70 family RNA polymerase sigma factor [Neolewinella antarctica]NJC28175.1 RNA polymerase sigma-70 factor (ECF subfamily) [Neolewinella antarctica]
MNEEFYKSWLPYVLTIVRRYGVHESDQKDLVQDIFLQLFRKYQQYDAEMGKLRPWLRTVAVSQVINHLRDRHRFRTEDLTELIERGPYVLAELQHLDAQYLTDMIAGLPLGFRTVFNLHVVEGYSHREIADRLGISSAGSRSQLSRAKSLLRHQLSKLVILNHVL